MVKSLILQCVISTGWLPKTARQFFQAQTYANQYIVGWFALTIYFGRSFQTQCSRGSRIRFMTGRGCLLGVQQTPCCMCCVC